MKFDVARLPNTRLIFIVACLCSLTWCIYRDIQIEKQYPGDLRNRVVGSRLQLDGNMPYFYHYQKGESLRYFDWNNTLRVRRNSNVTATPFFHQLLYPIANLPQSTISKIWLVLEYAAVLMMVLLSWTFARSVTNKVTILISSLLFLYSSGWTNHVFNGQLYIFIAAQATLFYFFLNRSPRVKNAVIAGIVGATMILTRPTAIVFIGSFLLVVNLYSRKFLAYMGSSFLLVFLLAFATTSSRSYWTNYRVAMAEHLEMHQFKNSNPIVMDTMADFRYVEGFDKVAMKKAAEFRWYRHNSANGNAFIFINSVLGYRAPVWLLALACSIFILVVAGLYFKMNGLPWNFFREKDRISIDLFSASLLGFIFYMATDIFSPIHRFQYNASQWIFPLLLIASAWKNRSGLLFTVLALAGVLLNSINGRMIPMQQTVGEYLVMAAMVGFVITYKPKTIQ